MNLSNALSVSSFAGARALCTVHVPAEVAALASLHNCACVFIASERGYGTEHRPKTEHKLPCGLGSTWTRMQKYVFRFVRDLWVATRPSAQILIGMTSTIQLFVCPNARTKHGVWAVALLLVAMKGPRAWSLDRVIGVEPSGLRS